jgi:hypothetical protein
VLESCSQESRCLALHCIVSVLRLCGATVDVPPDFSYCRIHLPEAGSFLFEVDGDGLYHCRVKVDEVTGVSLVTTHFTAEQKKRSLMVRDLHAALCHPSDECLSALLSEGAILNCPLTARDVSVSRAIQGPCQHCVMGKMVAPPYPPSLSTPASRPAELLHADIVYVAASVSKKEPHLVLVDDFSDFVMVKRLKSKGSTEVASALEAMFNLWTSWGHRPHTLRTDRRTCLGHAN